MTTLRHSEPRYTLCKCQEVKVLDKECFACENRLRTALNMLQREFKLQHLGSPEKSWIMLRAQENKHSVTELENIVAEVADWSHSKLRRTMYETV